MLKITGTKKEIDVIGEILNSVLEMLGGDVDSDGFGHEQPTGRRQKNTLLMSVNGESITETLEMIRDAIRLSYENCGAFSQKECWLDTCRSR